MKTTMEERDEPHIFKCPDCPQLFKSAYDEIGLGMDCPNCKLYFKIPNISEAVKFETTLGTRQECLSDDPKKDKTDSNFPIFDRLSKDEVKLLNGSSEILVENLKILTQQYCWEYFAVAALLCNQLENLKQTVLDTTYKQALQKGWKKNRSQFNRFLRTYVDDLFTALTSLYKLVSDDLAHALESDDLSTIFDLSKNFDQLIIKLAKIHVRVYHEPMPSEEPYLSVHPIVTDWVPHCCRTLLDFVDNLQRKCVNLRSSNKLCPQISLVSPTYYQIVKILAELEIGFRHVETVFPSKT